MASKSHALKFVNSLARHCQTSGKYLF